VVTPAHGTGPEDAVRASFRAARLSGLVVGLVGLVLFSSFLTAGSGYAPPQTGTRVVVLGTGTPNADPDRSGPAVAIVTGNEAYLVDAGPGVVRRAAAAAREGVTALEAQNLSRVFLTHLHSDHTLGLPDLMLSPWVLDRPDPLEVVGPAGTRRMTDGILEAWSEDIAIRRNGLEPRDHNVDAYRVEVTEVPAAGGPVYRDEHVRVTALPVHHGSWASAWGYRFDTADRTIVVSGDATPSPAIIEACDRCDVLVHEVYSAERFMDRPAEWQRYHADFHTSTTQLADIAMKARPTLLVLYHQLYWGATDDDLVREIREAGYDGAIVSARDLGSY